MKKLYRIRGGGDNDHCMLCNRPALYRIIFTSDQKKVQYIMLSCSKCGHRIIRRQLRHMPPDTKHVIQKHTFIPINATGWRGK